MTTTPLRILILEDLAADAELIRREVAFSGTPCITRWVEDRPSFLAALVDTPPDLILSDYSLPGFNALAALELAREMVPDAGFIVVTGSINEETAVGCIKAGADDYVLKDHLGRLGPAIHTTLQRRRAIAEAARVQETLRASEARFRDLWENANDLLVTVDMELRLTDVNRQVERVLGYARESVLGRTGTEFLRSTEGLDLAALQEAQLRGETVPPFEVVVAKASGEPLRLEISTRLMMEGESAVGFQVVARDLTERKRAEQELALWARVFAASGQAITITDPEGTILTVNRAFTTVTGYPAEEAVGKNPRILQSGRHRPDFYQNMWAALLASGQWSGEVWNRRKNGEVYPEFLSIHAVRDADGRTTHYIATFTDLTERKEAEERIRRLSSYDALTGLPNRALLYDRLQRSLAVSRRAEKRLGVLLLDIDRFKEVNDSLGHRAGDELLEQVAERLRRSVREDDTVGRMGGDEFLVLAPGLPSVESAARLTEQCMAAIAQPLRIGPHELLLTASVGIAVFPDDSEDAEGLLRDADAALGQAKGQGRGTYHFFTSDLNARALEGLILESQLRRALAERQFYLDYQPQFELGEGRLVGAEALIRWRHPDLGLVSPGRFIPLAEERGLITAIGEWVLNTACRQVKTWQDAGLNLPTLAVNLSASQFRQPGLAEQMAKLLAETGLRGECLELELTEGILMRETEAAIATVRELSAMGIRLSIDDFGTGWSSLHYLKRLPIHRLKIDQSFVRDLPGDADSQAIVGAIIGLGKSLRLRVIAEGVETEAQREFLREAGCDEIQGFLLGRPMPPEALARVIREGTSLPNAT